MLCVTFHASVRIVLPVSALAVDTDFAIVSVVSPSSSFAFSTGLYGLRIRMDYTDY